MKIKIALLAGMIAVAPFAGASAQSMLDMVDLKSDSFTKAEMSRADIEAAIAKLGPWICVQRLSMASIFPIWICGVQICKRPV